IGDIQARVPQDHQLRTPWFSPAASPALGGHQGLPRFPHLRLEGGSSSVAIGNLINHQELEWHLRSEKPPFVDLRDLYQSYGVQSQAGDATSIEIIARPPVEIASNSVISDRKLRLRLHLAQGADSHLVSIGYKAVGGSAGVLRGTIDNRLIRWTPQINQRLTVGHVEFDVGDSPTVQTFLAYTGTGIQTWWVLDPQRLLNPRSAIHKAFDH